VNPPAFQFYADDFIAGTGDMTTREVGVYIRLLCFQWGKGSLPNDETRLFMMAKTNNEPDNEAAVRYVVSNKFVVGDDGRLRNARMEQVRCESEQWRKRSSNGGKASAANRIGDSSWGKRMAEQRTKNEADNEAHNEPKQRTTTNPPSPSPTPVHKEGDASLSSAALIAEIFEAWNSTKGLTQCLLVSDKRRRSLSIRIREPFFAQNWRKAIDRVASSRFCQGESERGWKATFDWFITPDAVTKIMEGKYDNRNGTQISKPNPRNFGIVVGPTDYATAVPRKQRELEAQRAAKASMAGKVAPAENHAPTT